MSKRVIAGAVLALSSSLVLSLPEILTQPSVFAQDSSPEGDSYKNKIRDLYNKFNLQSGPSVFLRSGSYVDDINFDVLKALDTILEETPDNFEARYHRELVYGQLGDVIRSRTDFQYILDHKDADEQAAKYSIGAFSFLNSPEKPTGVVSGSLSHIVDGERMPVTNGIVAFLNSRDSMRSSQEWDLN